MLGIVSSVLLQLATLLWTADSPMRLRFTIRDLLWLTALVAVIAGWTYERTILRQRLNEFRESLQKSNAVLSDLTIELQNERSKSGR